MACEVPIVASNIGGLPELVRDGKDGFLCPLDDLDAFTTRTRQLLVDEDLHAEMSKAVRKRAVETFDIDHIVPQYEAYYERIREQRLAEV
jgi:glycosyltransferase involved in cell wall biosynthesis